MTTIDSGTPRPSTRTCRFVPIFPPVGGVPPHRLPRRRRLRDAAVHALPSPGYPRHLVVFREAALPYLEEEAGLGPFPEVPVNAAGAPERRGEGLPLDPRAQHEDDGLEHLPRGHGLPAAAGLPLVPPPFLALLLGDEGFH